MQKKIKKQKSKIPIWTTKEPLFFNKSDKNYSKYKKQLEQKGFSDSETFSLDYTIACFTLPRLKRYIDLADKSIVIDKEYREKLNKIVLALELIIKENDDVLTMEEFEQMKEGLRIFGENLRYLWW